MNDLFLKRRSIRKFKDKEVEEDKINRILEIALTSPSGRNKKPWDLVVVKDKNTLKSLAHARIEATSFIENAPLAITILFDSTNSTTAVEDATILATYIQLATELEGLGSCWGHSYNKINFKGENVEENIRKILNIPENLNILCTIAIGYKNEDKLDHNISNLKYDKIHFEKY